MENFRKCCDVQNREEFFCRILPANTGAFKKSEKKEEEQKMNRDEMEE